MDQIGTEGLPMFDGATDLQPPTGERPRGAWLTGPEMKAQALADHADRRAADIQKVRVALLAGAKLAQSTTLTADDASVVVERLGLTTGKWLGAIFRNWPAVAHTGTYVKSTLPRSRARMIAVWAIQEAA